MKWFAVLLAIFALQFCLINSQSYSVTTFAYLTSRPNFSSCHCYPEGYNCVSYSTSPLTATFIDPITSSGAVTITNVEVTMTGSLYCTSPSTNDNFGLAINSISLSPLVTSGLYACSCSCNSVSNSTYFPSGLSNYYRYGNNTITITPSYYSDACFSGVNVTLTYQYYSTNTYSSSPSVSPTRYAYPTNSATRTPTPTRTPTRTPPAGSSSTPYPSPVPSSSGSGSSYECCIYVSDSTSDYSITCTTTSTCPSESGFTLISQFPTTDCAQCFA